MPVYYATGSRWKAVLWSVVPALAEPLGGLLVSDVFRVAVYIVRTYEVVVMDVVGVLSYD